MKKLITLAMALVFVFTMTTGVFAAEPTKTVDPEKAALRAEVKDLVSQLKSLTAERKTLAEQVKAKHDTIKTLSAAAKEAGETDKLQAAKAFKADLKSMNEEIKALAESKKEIRLEVKAAKGDKDIAAVKAGLTQIIEYKKQIIEKVNAKLAVLDEAIAALQ